MEQFLSDNKALIIGLSGAAVVVLAWFGGLLRWAWKLILGRRSEPNSPNSAKSSTILQTAENSTHTAQVGKARDVIIKQGGATEDIAAGIARGLTEVFGKERQELEGQLQAKDEEVRALTGVVEELQARAAQPGAPQYFEDALAKLKNNETAEAEEIFQDILEQKKAEGESANKDAAAAARHIGALAYLHDTKKALEAYRQAVDLDPDDPGGWNMLGVVLLQLGDLNEAETAFEKVLYLGNRLTDKTMISAANCNLGLIYRTWGDLARAEEFLSKSLALDEELGDKGGMAANYSNLGGVYKVRDDLERAEDFVSKSLALNQELGIKDGMAGDYGHLGLIYQMRGALDRAEEFVGRSLAFYEELGSKEGAAIQYGSLALIYRDQGDLDRAKKNHRKSLALHKELGRKEGMATQYGNLGQIYQMRGDLDRAEEFHRKSLALNEALGHKDGMASQHGNLGVIYRDRGDRANACEHWVKAKALFEEIGAKDRVEHLAKLMRDAHCL